MPEDSESLDFPMWTVLLSRIAMLSQLDKGN